jgi:dihydrolipoamide dehydrogenase
MDEVADKRGGEVLVIGGGPGGYPAAFLAADMGMNVTLVDLEPNPGGICLYRGCIPSKALLHIARVLNESREAAEMGISFAEPSIDLEKLRGWKEKVVGRLTGGLGQMGRQRHVRFVQGRARLVDAHTAAVAKADGGEERLTFDHAIVATGSRPAIPQNLAIDSPRFMDSTAALRMEEVPGKLLVIGGGYIGLELGTVYSALGSRVTVVEMTPGLLPGADRDLVPYLQRRLEKLFDAVYLSTRVTALKEEEGGIRASLSGLHVPEPEMLFDKVLVAVGRRPNSADLGLENTRVEVNERGFIKVDGQRRTAEPSIFSIGDVAGEPMLAHKASYEARVAVEAIAGQPTTFDARAIPAVVFTDPEIAWAGLTETEALDRNIPHKVVRFPWAASGRATTLERNDGLTKLVLDPHSEAILGVGIAGVGAGELIAEGVLAVEMGARAADLMMAIHAHPTLSETVMEAAGLYLGHSPNYIPRKS